MRIKNEYDTNKLNNVNALLYTFVNRRPVMYRKTLKKILLASYKKKIFENIKNKSSLDSEAIYFLKKHKNKLYKVEQLLRIEEHDHFFFRRRQQECFERESFNSIHKEKMLFSEYEKISISLFHLIFENQSSNHILIPSTKDIRNIYKDPRITKKYYLDTKNLEKIFLASSYTRINDPHMHQILKNSTVNMLNRLTYNAVSLHANIEKAPPDILKELTKIKITITQIQNTECSHSNYSLYLRKFYHDLKWNNIFLNRICREKNNIKRRLLEHTYNKHYKIHYMLLDSIINKTSNIENSYRRLLCYIWAVKQYIRVHKNEKHKRSVNYQTEINNAYKETYAHACLIVLQDITKEKLRNRIVNNYMPYITMMSKQYIKSGYIADVSDLIQEGTLGLIEAIDRYQLGRGVRFLTYAYWWMHRYMIKVTIKKIKVIKLNTKTKTQKKLIAHIGKLYNNLQKKKKKERNLSLKQKRTTIDIRRLIGNNNKIIPIHKHIRKTVGYKAFILCSLYIGLPPYKKHTISQIASIFDVPQSAVLHNIKKIQKYIVNNYSIKK